MRRDRVNSPDVSHNNPLKLLLSIYLRNGYFTHAKSNKGLKHRISLINNNVKQSFSQIVSPNLMCSHWSEVVQEEEETQLRRTGLFASVCVIQAAVLCCRGVGGEAVVWQVSGGTPEH